MKHFKQNSIIIISQQKFVSIWINIQQWKKKISEDNSSLSFNLAGLVARQSHLPYAMYHCIGCPTRIVCSVARPLGPKWLPYPGRSSIAHHVRWRKLKWPRLNWNDPDKVAFQPIVNWTDLKQTNSFFLQIIIWVLLKTINISFQFLDFPLNHGFPESLYPVVVMRSAGKTVSVCVQDFETWGYKSSDTGGRIRNPQAANPAAVSILI